LTRRLDLRYQNPEYIKLENLIRFKRKQQQIESVNIKTESKLTKNVSKSLIKLTKRQTADD
jgi:hypothetical protein